MNMRRPSQVRACVDKVVGSKSSLHLGLTCGNNIARLTCSPAPLAALSCVCLPDCLTAPAPTCPSPADWPVLHEGDGGRAVHAMHVALEKAGFYPSGVYAGGQGRPAGYACFCHSWDGSHSVCRPKACTHTSCPCPSSTNSHPLTHTHTYTHTYTPAPPGCR